MHIKFSWQAAFLFALCLLCIFNASKFYAFFDPQTNELFHLAIADQLSAVEIVKKYEKLFMHYVLWISRFDIVMLSCLIGFSLIATLLKRAMFLIFLIGVILFALAWWLNVLKFVSFRFYSILPPSLFRKSPDSFLVINGTLFLIIGIALLWLSLRYSNRRKKISRTLSEV